MDIEEERFGFEPEITAKITHMGCRVYEIPVSYSGRTFAEGKKINWKDGMRALYCIFHYNAHRAPLPLQLILYFLIGGVASVVNIGAFAVFHANGFSIPGSAAFAYVLAAALNYFLCIALLFRHRSRWSTGMELFFYLVLVVLIGAVDVLLTTSMAAAIPAVLAKAVACGLVFILNFAGRKYLVFPGSDS